MRESITLLTEDPMKRESYPSDRYYQEGLTQLTAVAGDNALEVLDRTTLAIFNPACVICGQVRNGIQFLKKHKYEVVYASLYTYTEAAVTEVWRHQLDTFRPDRWELIVKLLVAGPSLVVVLKDQCLDSDLSASRRLKELKGPSEPGLCSEAHLRRRLGAMNRIINLVHSSDDSCDMVREGAIVFGQSELKAALRCAAGLDNLITWNALKTWYFCIPLESRWGGVSVAHVGVFMRWRMLQTIRAMVRGRQPIDDAKQLVMEELEWVRAQSSTKPLSVIDAYREMFGSRSVAPLVREASNMLWDEVDMTRYDALASAFEQVELILVSESGDTNRLWRGCEDAGFLVDPWESLVMSTQQVMASVKIEEPTEEEPSQLPVRSPR